MAKLDFVQDVRKILKLKTFIKEEVSQIVQPIVNPAHLTKLWKE